jgi:hypothetical protein
VTGVQPEREVIDADIAAELAAHGSRREWLRLCRKWAGWRLLRCRSIRPR